MRIVIAAPYYNPSKGGHIAIHKLCDSLLKQGLDAYLLPQNPKKFSTNPKYLSKVTDSFDNATDIAIYHNSIKGNPWNAKRIIRWMLYRPTNEMDGVILYYSPVFGSGPVLRVIEPHLDTFFDMGFHRNGHCWTWRKAEREGWTPDQKPEDGFEIPRGLSNENLVGLFNIKERFISYDGATFLNVQAALCGCDSLVMRPLGGFFTYPGVATCEADIPKARYEWPLLRETLEREYQEQDARAAEVVTWAISRLM